MRVQLPESSGNVRAIPARFAAVLLDIACSDTTPEDPIVNTRYPISIGFRQNSVETQFPDVAN